VPTWVAEGGVIAGNAVGYGLENELAVRAVSDVLCPAKAASPVFSCAKRVPLRTVAGYRIRHGHQVLRSPLSGAHRVPQLVDIPICVGMRGADHRTAPSWSSAYRVRRVPNSVRSSGFAQPTARCPPCTTTGRHSHLRRHMRRADHRTAPNSSWGGCEKAADDSKIVDNAITAKTLLIVSSPYYSLPTAALRQQFPGAIFIRLYCGVNPSDEGGPA